MQEGLLGSCRKTLEVQELHLVIGITPAHQRGVREDGYFIPDGLTFEGKFPVQAK